MSPFRFIRQSYLQKYLIKSKDRLIKLLASAKPTSYFMEIIMKTRRRNSVTKTARRPGQMRPFSPEQIAMLETLLRQDASATALRDLALLRVGVDSMLRSSDLVGVTAADVHHDGTI